MIGAYCSLERTVETNVNNNTNNSYNRLRNKWKSRALLHYELWHKNLIFIALVLWFKIKTSQLPLESSGSATIRLPSQNARCLFLSHRNNSNIPEHFTVHRAACRTPLMCVCHVCVGAMFYCHACSGRVMCDAMSHGRVTLRVIYL